MDRSKSIADAHGVPHVYARDTDDAWFAAGALHARDRLWQMELYRRASLGRLAEALGEPALPIDRRMLTLRIRAAADAEFARLGGPARTALTRYAEGVNAAMAGLQGRRRPPELQMLGITPAAVDAARFSGRGPAAGLSSGRERERRARAARSGERRGRGPGRRAHRPVSRERSHRPWRAQRIARAAVGHSARSGPAAAERAAHARARAPAPFARAFRAAELPRGARLARSERPTREQQCLGRVGQAHGHGPAAAGQRPAPAHRAAVGVVRAAPRGRRPRRARRVAARARRSWR